MQILPSTVRLFREACFFLYPEAYRSNATIIMFENRLPLEICQQIHRYREFVDLQISMTKVRTILGFQNAPLSSLDYNQRRKDRILYQLITETYRHNEELDFNYLANDRHLLMMSLYVSLKNGVRQYFPIVKITTLEMARELVVFTWQAYAYFDGEYRDNRELALLAVHQHVKAYDYMPLWLRLDRVILRFVLPRMDGVFFRLNEELRSDEEMIKLALKRVYINYKYIPTHLQRERWVVELMPKDALSYRLLHDIPKQDLQIILSFLNECIEVYFCLDPEQKKHPEIEHFYLTHNTVEQ